MFWYADSAHFQLHSDNTQTAEMLVSRFDRLQSIIEEKKEKAVSVFMKAYNSKYTDEFHVPSWMVFEELSI